MQLHKLHGLGNDFLVTFCDTLPDHCSASRRAVELCNRRRGIGADGLIFATQPWRVGSSAKPIGMQLWNSDGSAAEVSGNGLRCLAHAIARVQRTDELDVVIQTVAGSKRCTIEASAMSTTATGMVAIGAPVGGPLPMDSELDFGLEVDSIVGAGVKRCKTLSVGNPHAVLEVADPSVVPLEQAGPAIEAMFADGINVHFGALSAPDQVSLTIWERGAGVTEACGSGAVAAAAAFYDWGVVGQDVEVKMPGGTARVDLRDPVTLTGESTYVALVTIDGV